MMTITTQTRKMIRSTFLTGLAALTLMTATSASATTYCDEINFKQVYAYSDYTKDTHIHLDVACPYDYQATSCEFDAHGRDDGGQHKFFVAIQDSTPAKFDSGHNGHKLDQDNGCHFRANNFATYFPGGHEFYWRLMGTATCAPKRCVDRYETHDYYDENFNSNWYPRWDGWHN